MIQSLLTTIKALFIGLICCYLGVGLIKINPISNNEPYDWYTENGHYVLDLKTVITEDQKNYQELATKIKDLSAADTLVIKLHSYGGSVESGTLITNALDVTKAKTIADVESHAWSMAAVIACHAKTLSFGTNSFLMFHSASNETGNVNDELGYAINQNLNACMTKGILTQEQVDSITFQKKEVYYWPNNKERKSPFFISTPAFLNPYKVK